MTVERNRRLMTVVKALVGGGAVVVGLVVVLMTIAVGHCSAFGGRCPGDSAFDNEVFFSAASGAALATAVPFMLRRPALRKLQSALVKGSGFGALVGIAALAITSG